MDEVGDSRCSLFLHALSRAEWSRSQLWLDYLGLGGAHDAFDLEAYLEGLMPWSVVEQDILAVALNERLYDLYLADCVPYLEMEGRAPAPDPTPIHILNRLLGNPPDEAY